MIRLGLPLAGAQVGWMTMRIVDTLMVAPLGATAIAAISLGDNLVFPISLIAVGILAGGIEPGVSQALGAGKKRLANVFLFNGLVLSLVFGLIGTLLISPLLWVLGPLGYDPDLARLASHYMGAVLFGIFPFMGFTVCRAYLQSVGVAAPIFAIVMLANLTNMIGNTAFIHGEWGFPAWGVFGSGFVTSINRFFIFAAVFLLLIGLGRRKGWHFRLNQWKPRRAVLSSIGRVGLPAGLHLAMEVGVFALAGILAGRFGPEKLAAHHIAITIVGLTFMIPLGVSFAATARVGLGYGGGSFERLQSAGWAAISLSVGFAALVSLFMIIFPREIVQLFTHEPAVVDLASTLLRVGGMVHAFDALQMALTGVLRGLSDTRYPFWMNMIGHWGFGLPIGVTLAFGFNWGPLGLWWGLNIGLTLVAILLLVRWLTQLKRIRFELIEQSLKNGCQNQVS